MWLINTNQTKWKKTLIQWGTWIMGQITATRNLVATKVVRLAGQWWIFTSGKKRLPNYNKELHQQTILTIDFILLLFVDSFVQMMKFIVLQVVPDSNSLNNGFNCVLSQCKFPGWKDKMDDIPSSLWQVRCIVFWYHYAQPVLVFTIRPHRLSLNIFHDDSKL